jgi:replicative DNA helicase
VTEQYRDDVAEYALLAACISRPALIGTAAACVCAEDYGNPAHATVWQCVVGLVNGDKPITLALVRSELIRLNRYNVVEAEVNLAALEYGDCEDVVFQALLERVSDAARARRVLRTANRAQHQRPTESPAEYSDRVLAEVVEAARSRSVSDPVSLSNVAVELDAELAFRSTAQGAGVPTGLADLDMLIAGGFRPGQLIVEAGRPGTGKTSLLLRHALIAAQSGRGGALLFSLEMSRTELMLRLACDLASVNAQLFTQAPTDTDAAAIQTAMHSLSQLPLWIVDQPNQTLEAVRSTTLRWAAKYPLALVGIDYLQLLDLQVRDARELQVATGRATRKLKVLAREANVPVVLLSQLNRDCEKRSNKRPMVSDLRDSGSIEQDADIVALIYRHALYAADHIDDGTAEIDVAKQRGGARGVVRVGYQAVYTRFHDLSEPPQPRPQERRGTGNSTSHWSDP